jgi:hypothetical protein
VIHDEIRALRPNKVTYLPSYLAQLYKHGNYLKETQRVQRLRHKQLIINVYGTLEDTLTKEEEESDKQSVEIEEPKTEGEEEASLEEEEEHVEAKQEDPKISIEDEKFLRPKAERPEELRHEDMEILDHGVSGDQMDVDQSPGSPEVQSIAEGAIIALLHLAKKEVEVEEHTHVDHTAIEGEEYQDFINQEDINVKERRFVLVTNEESGEVMRPLGRIELLALGLNQP